jgi:hypothetical protein
MTLVDDMDHGSQRIKEIVEGLRTFARKDEGLLVDTIDINTLIGASARLVHNEVHKHADIRLDLADGSPPSPGTRRRSSRSSSTSSSTRGRRCPTTSAASSPSARGWRTPSSASKLRTTAPG